MSNILKAKDVERGMKVALYPYGDQPMDILEGCENRGMISFLYINSDGTPSTENFLSDEEFVHIGNATHGPKGGWPSDFVFPEAPELRKWRLGDRAMIKGSPAVIAGFTTGGLGFGWTLSRNSIQIACGTLIEVGPEDDDLMCWNELEQYGKDNPLSLEGP